MATRTVLTCDLCGKDAVDTIAIGSRVVDLCATHVGQYERAIKPFADAAHRPAPGPTPPARRGARRAAPAKPARSAPGMDAQARAWARANGVPVTSRGRVSPEVMAKYRAAGQGTGGQ